MADDNKASIIITAKDKTAEAIGSVKGNLSSLGSHAEKINGMMGALLPAMGAAAFTEIINQSSEAADKLFVLSQKTGVTVESLNGLGYAAKMNGADAEEMAKSVQKLSLYLANAQISGGQHADMLKKLGVTAKDPTEAMYQVADAIKSIEDPAQRTYVATQLMGKGGAAMIPVMLDGGEAMKKMVEEGQKLNPITAEFAAQSNQLHDNLDRLQIRAKGTATILAEGIVPAANDVIQAWVDMSGNGHEVAEFFAKGLGDALRGIALGAGFVVFSFKQVGEEIGFLAAEATALANGDLDQMKAISAQHDKEMANIDADWEKFRDKMLGLSSSSTDAANNLNQAKRTLEGTGNQQMDNFIARIQKMTEGFNTAALTGNKLTEAQKMQLELNKLIETGQLQVSEAQKKRIEQTIGEMGVAEQFAKQKEKDRAARDEALKLIEKSHANAKFTIEEMEFEQSLYGKSSEEIKRLTAAHNADLNVRKQISELQANDKFKDHPEQIAKVTAAKLEEAEADRKRFEARQSLDLIKQFEQQDPGAGAAARYKKQLEDLNAFHAKGLLSERDFQNQLYQAEADNQSAMMALFVQGKLSEKQLNEMHWYDRLDGDAQKMQAIIGAGAQHSRALFNMNKAAALAHAAIALPQTVMDAYMWGNKFMGGPIGGAAMGAIAFASQMAQMQAIQSAQFGGGAVGSAPSAGGTSGLPGQAANPNVIGAPPAAQQVAPQTTVHITVQALDPSVISDATLLNLGNRLAPAIQQNLARGGGNVVIMA